MSNRIRPSRTARYQPQRALDPPARPARHSVGLQQRRTQSARIVELCGKTSRCIAVDSEAMSTQYLSPSNVTAPVCPDCESLLAPLMRYARSRVRNTALSEDAVSETLLAALESGQSFQTPAQAMAWMYGVLRHKLVDQLRRQGRETPSGDLVSDGIAESAPTGTALAHGPTGRTRGACPSRSAASTSLSPRWHVAARTCHVCNARPS
jgi:hypothetical protein